MGRVSKQTRTSAIFIAAAAALGAMTVYNVNRARKAESEHPPKGEFVTVDGVRLITLKRVKGRQSSCFMAIWLQRKTSIQAECWAC